MAKEMSLGLVIRGCSAAVFSSELTAVSAVEHDDPAGNGARRPRLMQHFRNILVGIELANADDPAEFELTAPNEEALRRAIWLAAHTQGRLTIFSAVDISESARAILAEEPEHVEGDYERVAFEMLERYVERAKAQGVDAVQKVGFGTPWLEICRQAVGDNHDLVVIGTRNLGQIGRILFGSTGVKLLRNCPCPVWITRPDPNWDDLNILVPSDLTEVSLDALRIAVNGGQLVDTRLHLLHAVEGMVAPPPWFGKAQRKIVNDFLAQERAEATRRLHEQLSFTDYRTLPKGVQVHVVDGPPDEAILKAIDDFQIDLVVMGTAGGSGLSGFVVGTTAERLVSHMKCSVIAVKPSGFQCPVECERQNHLRSPAPPSP
jgi:universal stress protein E